MQIANPRQKCVLLRRYKRFLADVRLEDGTELTVHCPNSGSMLGCSAPGSPAVISASNRPGRKYAWTLELVHGATSWIGVNTARTNALVREAIEEGVLDFGHWTTIRPEVVVPGGSRLDFLLEADPPIYLEVKNCSLARDGMAMFPDAVTARGARHLEALMALRRAGLGAALVFCVQREDADVFSPAREIDPHYADTLTRAAAADVTILACQAQMRPDSIRIVRTLPVRLQESEIAATKRRKHKK
ncbi:MAG: hypothetical protein BWK76_15635 [Desulfobulbaceae bacterium A2]|nr:MAG: hypothetical protein BWK76_15635 [Desulfobulbaceae bacterium A2]